MISKEKSAFYPLKHIIVVKKRALLRASSFEEGIFPFMHLGVPLVVGRLTKHVLEPLVNKVRNKVAD